MLSHITSFYRKISFCIFIVSSQLISKLRCFKQNGKPSSTTVYRIDDFFGRIVPPSKKEGFDSVIKVDKFFPQFTDTQQERYFYLNF